MYKEYWTEENGENEKTYIKIIIGRHGIIIRNPPIEKCGNNLFSVAILWGVQWDSTIAQQGTDMFDVTEITSKRAIWKQRYL